METTQQTTVTTPAAAKAPPPAPGPEAQDEPTGFAKLVADLDEYAPPEEPAEEGAEAEAEGAPDKAGEKAKAAAAADDPFSEKALSTPEGVKAARQVLEKRQRKIDGFDIKLQKRAKEWERKHGEEQSKLAADRALAGTINNALNLVRKGNAQQVLQGLGILTGRDGAKVYEEIIETVVKDGRHGPSLEVQRLEQQIAQLADYIKAGEERGAAEQERRTQAEGKHIEGGIQRRLGEIAEASTDAGRYPHLAAYAGENGTDEIVDEVRKLMVAAYDGGKGRGLAQHDALCFFEERLAKLAGSAAGPKAAEHGSGSRQTPGGKQARSTPANTSIPPSVARSSPSAREMTEEERLEDLRRDRDALEAMFPNYRY